MRVCLALLFLSTKNTGRIATEQMQAVDYYTLAYENFKIYLLHVEDTIKTVSKGKGKSSFDILFPNTRNCIIPSHS